MFKKKGKKITDNMMRESPLYYSAVDPTSLL